MGMFEQTNFFFCIIVILFIVLFLSSMIDFEKCNDIHDTLDVHDSDNENKQQFIIEDDIHAKLSDHELQENKSKAILIAKVNNYSFYEYLKQLDFNELSEPYEIRTIEFWMQYRFQLE